MENPTGDTNLLAVAMNNRLVSRICLIMDYLNKKGCYYILEQPTDSCMELHPRLKKLFKKHGAEQVQAQMGAFGGDSVKHLSCFSAQLS